MKLQVALHDTAGKAVVIVETPQELWDALVSATEPMLSIYPRYATVKVNRVITLDAGGQ